MDRLCPFCDEPPEIIKMRTGNIYHCPDRKCAGNGCIATQKEWNKRGIYANYTGNLEQIKGKRYNQQGDVDYSNDNPSAPFRA